MREVCFCGRTGEFEDRQPILDDEGRWVLICPECGHADGLAWLSEEARLHLWSKVGFVEVFEGLAPLPFE